MPAVGALVPPITDKAADDVELDRFRPAPAPLGCVLANINSQQTGLASDSMIRLRCFNFFGTKFLLFEIPVVHRQDMHIV